MEPEEPRPGPEDARTAEGFAAYFRTVADSQYTARQFQDYFHPLEPASFRGKEIVELGFGHASWLVHWAGCGPSRLSGCDLGDAVEAGRRKLSHLPAGVLNLQLADLVTADLGPHDLAYCIGVLHHLRDPDADFEAVLRHVKRGGHFHCWVYSREGNAFVRHGVDLLRRIGGPFPWWLTKWSSALLVALPLFAYAKALRTAAGRCGSSSSIVHALPLAPYCLTHADRGFRFFHFLATDFLVARHTVYFDRARIESWLRRPEIDPASVYLLHRNSNSWQFGGRKRQ